MKANSEIVVFTCNWNAYTGLETAGANKRAYTAALLPVRVMCLGRLKSGHILKAFEKGAQGVLLIGCSPSECHYDTDSALIEGVFNEAQKILQLLGFCKEQLHLSWLDAGDDELFVETVQAFVTRLKKIQKPIGKFQANPNN